MKLTTIRTALFFAAAMALTQCSSDKKPAGDVVQPHEAEEHEAERDITETAPSVGKPKFTVDEIFRKQVTELFDAYVEMKDAFVSSDAGKVQKEAQDTRKALEKVDKSLLSGEALNDWTQHANRIAASLQTIEASNDIEAQRAQFSEVSGSLYNTIKAFGLSGKTAYYEFCPMAFDDKGAYWLSNEEKIRNPYFGEKMLTCGSVEETLQ